MQGGRKVPQEEKQGQVVISRGLHSAGDEKEPGCVSVCVYV